MKTKLDFQNAADEIDLPSKNDFQCWVDAANQHHSNAEVCMRLTSVGEIQSLNKTYRQKDNPTNVLSFAYAADDNFEPNEDGTLYLGDIIICPSIIEKEAAEQAKPLRDHYAHMCVHGMLHLLGYDHQTNEEADIMEALEIKILKTFNINNPYQVKTA